MISFKNMDRIIKEIKQQGNWFYWMNLVQLQTWMGFVLIVIFRFMGQCILGITNLSIN